MSASPVLRELKRHQQGVKDDQSTHQVILTVHLAQASKPLLSVWLSMMASFLQVPQSLFSGDEKQVTSDGILSNFCSQLPTYLMGDPGEVSYHILLRSSLLQPQVSNPSECRLILGTRRSIVH